MSSDVEKLKAARELVTNGWTKFFAATNSKGESVPYDDPDACKFCSYGALWRAGVPVCSNQTDHFLERVIVGGHIADWNDAPERTQADVVATFDAAIALAEAEAANAPA